MPARSAKRASSSSILRQLGIVGWDPIEPVILAAVAAELPLLLVGPHGSAKTLLLARLAACLGLAHRQYNASLLNFDDLVGFPVPDGGKIVYLQTPATIWEAESVFFDEISRCRPDLQNKLFPIVHDRVVQGVPLERLRHRWAAMNPPPAVDGVTASHEYAGTEPLDVALADRFAFIVNVPSFADLSREDQLAVLAGGHRQHAGAEERVRAAVQAVREALAADTGEWRSAAAEYVHIAAAKLAGAGHPLSTRRAVQVTANIGAVRAALAVSGGGHALDDVFYCALRVSLPDGAWGNPVPASTVLTVHRAAWEAARLEAGSPLKAIHAETNPVRRIALALGLRHCRPPGRPGDRRQLCDAAGPGASRHGAGPDAEAGAPARAAAQHSRSGRPGLRSGGCRRRGDGDGQSRRPRLEARHRQRRTPAS